MSWKMPSHRTKYYEALGCVGDSRVELLGVEDGTINAKVLSSDRSKAYEVSYNESLHAIMSNDNSSYRKGELGYPSMALLLFLDILDYQSDYGEALSGVPWKTINTANNNNFDLTQSQVEEKLRQNGLSIEALHTYCDGLEQTLQDMKLGLLGATILPPK